MALRQFTIRSTGIDEQRVVGSFDGLSSGLGAELLTGRGNFQHANSSERSSHTLPSIPGYAVDFAFHHPGSASFVVGERPARHRKGRCHMFRAPRAPFESKFTGSLHVEVECGRCASKQKYEVPWALVHPEPDACDAEGWDGVLLGRVIECAGCGAVDDYAVTSMARLLLASRILASPDAVEADPAAATVPTGARLGVATLSDGTVVRRPTQAVDALCRVTTEQANRGQSGRRVGDASHRHGRETEPAWRRAIRVDAGELKAG